MIWIVIGVVLIALGYIYRRNMGNVLLKARYEAMYWLVGGAATVDDIIYYWRNQLKDMEHRKGEVVIITGGARGIGLEVVKKLLEYELHVVIACRNTEAGDKAVAQLRQDGIKTGTTDVIQLDVGSLKSVRTFAEKVQQKYKQISILISNAGIMFVPYEVTEDGFESHLAVNYLGHYLLSHLLLPSLKHGALDRPSRIINVSSCAYMVGSINFDDISYKKSLYMPSEAYAQSKLAQMLFTRALSRQLQGENVSVFAVHPGVVNTELFNGTTIKTYLPILMNLFRTPEQGCRSIVHAALSPILDTKTGFYITNCSKMWVTGQVDNIENQDRLLKLTDELVGIKQFGVY